MTESRNITKAASYARGHTDAAYTTILKIMHNEDASPTVRLAAANSILDRGWGKPTQTIAGDEENPLRMIQRIERVIIDPPK